MNSRKVLTIVAVCLAVATIFLAYYTVQAARAYREFEMITYWAEEIDSSAVAWNLTDPDPYILEAISQAGPEPGWVRARRNETNFIDQVRAHGDVWEIAYNGTYYYVTCYGSCDPHSHPNRYALPVYYLINDRRMVETQVAAADVSLGGLWVTWAIGWRKKSTL